MIDAADRIETARALLRDALVWDNHGCMPMRPEDLSFLPQLARPKSVGVDVAAINIGFGSFDLAHHLRMIASLRAWVRTQDDLMLAETVADIDRARAEGRMAIVFDIEGMAPLDGGDHGLVEMFYDLGVRWMLVAYNAPNAAGSGCLGEDEGLTAHGRAVLREMERVGMVPCCSHTGHRTARDVLSSAQGPVIFSHSNAAEVHPHFRNIPDDLIRACAATGGVVGVNGIGTFVGDNDIRPESFARHIDHMVQLVGPEHVGIALDYVYDAQEMHDFFAEMRAQHPDDPQYAVDLEMVEPEALPAIVAELIGLGYDEPALRKILGLNWRRVAEACWR